MRFQFLIVLLLMGLFGTHPNSSHADIDIIESKLIGDHNFKIYSMCIGGYVFVISCPGKDYCAPKQTTSIVQFIKPRGNGLAGPLRCEDYKK